LPSVVDAIRLPAAFLSLRSDAAKRSGPFRPQRGEPDLMPTNGRPAGHRLEELDARAGDRDANGALIQGRAKGRRMIGGNIEERAVPLHENKDILLSFQPGIKSERIVHFDEQSETRFVGDPGLRRGTGDFRGDGR
jgi:hypothetical protein